MERHSSLQARLSVLVVVLVCGLSSGCSSGKEAAPATPTLDAEAVQQAAVATLVARLSEATTTPTAVAPAQATATSSAGDILKKLPTLAPTDVPEPTRTAKPTRTPVPTSTPQLSISIDLVGMHYEAWGSPVNNGCQQFDDGHPMRKFQMQITLYNGSNQKIADWYPQFYANNGRLVITCFYGIGNVKGFPEVPARDSRTVTFAAFAEQNEWITRMKMAPLGQEFIRCFNTSGALVGCQ